MIQFTKMQALGNDFVVIDETDQLVGLTEKLAKLVAHRRYGIGCDQILLVKASDDVNLFDFTIFNADGSESMQCGNGARCVAKFLYDRSCSNTERIMLRTRVDTMHCTVKDDNVTVAIGVPNFNPADIPFVSDREQTVYDLDVDNEIFQISAVSIGNPHAVMLVENVEHAPVAKTGSAIEFHTRFPQRTNVGYMEIESMDSIRLRVHERGVGETYACGSGACAAAVVGHWRGLLASEVEVKLAGGSLWIKWGGLGERVLMTGQAEYVFEGQMRLD